MQGGGLAWSAHHRKSRQQPDLRRNGAGEGAVAVHGPAKHTVAKGVEQYRVLNYQLALLRRELSIIRVLNYSTSSLRNTHLPGSVSSIVQRDIQGGGR